MSETTLVQSTPAVKKTNTWWVLFFIFFAVIFYALNTFGDRLFSGGGSPEKQRMASMSTRLAAADKKGDAAAATQMLDDSIAVFRALNPTGSSSAANKDCLLAATHLSNGISAVMRGAGWDSQSRFDAAMRDCH